MCCTVDEISQTQVGIYHLGESSTILTVCIEVLQRFHVPSASSQEKCVGKRVGGAGS